MNSDLYLAVGLLLLGLVFIFLEVFIPSLGTLALAAGACLIAALWLAFKQGTATGVGFLVTTLIVVPLAVRYAFVLLPHTPFGRKLMLNVPGKEVLGSGAYQRDQALLGKEGTAVSSLRPAGVAQIEDKRVDVMTEGSHVEAGSRVRVVEVKGNRVVVRAVASATETTGRGHS